MKKILLLLLVANIAHAQFIGAPRRGLSSSAGGGGSETDPVYSASPAAGITAPNITNWLSAYSWGNHASAGYLGSSTAASTYQTLANLSTDLTSSASKYPSVNAVNTGLGLKANLASPTFTGTPTLPTGTIATTQTAGNSTTAIATTNFVTTADNLKANLASPTFTGTVVLPSTTSIGGITNTELGYVDGVTSAIQTQIDSKPAANNGTLTGTTTTGNVAPASNGTSDIGTSLLKYQTVFTNRVNAVGTLSLISGGSNPILFSTASPTSGVHGGFSDSKLILQSPGTSLTSSTGELFQNNGTSKFTGNASFGANIQMSAIPAMGTKPTLVLVPDGSGNISSRTNAQHFADINEIQNYRRTAFFEATGNGTSTSIIGLLVSTQGTTTTRNVAATNFYTSTRKLGYVGATTANAPAGLTGNNAQFQVARGFSFRAVFAIQDYDAGHRYFVGMGETTDNTVDPSALVNRLHMYADPGDVTWKIRGANASQGTAVDLGANFPVNTSATDVYDVTFNCEPGATSATYLVRRLNTGDTASGTISTVPGSVLIRPQVIASNAATGTAASIDIARIILITDN